MQTQIIHGVEGRVHILGRRLVCAMQEYPKYY